MNQSASLVQHLKQLIKQSGKTYSDIAASAGCSEANIKRIFSQQRMTLARFDDICRALGSNLVDVVVAMRGGSNTQKSLSQQQEQALAQDRGLFVYFYLLSRDWKVARIAKRYAISQPQHNRIMLDLEKLGLISYLPGNKVKLLVDNRLSWRPGSDLTASLFGAVAEEFFSSNFSAPQETFRFLTGELSEHSIALINKRTAEFSQDIEQIIAYDRALPKEDTKATGILVATRPWIFSLFKNWDGQSREPLTK
jgi:DNA-binding Xre family transcriptional regulator